METIKREYVFTLEHIKILLRAIKKEKTSRETAKELGISHQQVLNLISHLFREWFSQDLIFLSPELYKKYGLDIKSNPPIKK
jgi:phage regulator Rha-like protein